MKNITLTQEEQRKKDAIVALKIRVHCGAKPHRRYNVVG